MHVCRRETLCRHICLVSHGQAVSDIQNLGASRREWRGNPGGTQVFGRERGVSDSSYV